MQSICVENQAEIVSLKSIYRSAVDLSMVSVIIPVLNEEKAIGMVIDEIVSIGISRDNIVVVDGGSSDRTVEIAKSRQVLVVPQEGRGKADAVRTGLRYVSTPYVVVIDGDGTYPAKYIPAMLEALESNRCDLVIGARIYGHGSQKPVFRFGNKVLTKFFNILFGTNLRDVLSGMYMARVDELSTIGFEMDGFSLESEIVSHFASFGNICEIPIEYRSRVDPKAKKLNVFHGLKIAKDIVRLMWRYNPTLFISSIGILMLIPGLVLGGYTAYHYFFTGIKHYVKGVIAVILTATGLISFVVAVLSLYIKRFEIRITRQLEKIRKEMTKNIKRYEVSQDLLQDVSIDNHKR
ncbi:MAG: glycosyltransferase [Ignisphaera sp.]